jgi:hypothetical protein
MERRLAVILAADVVGYPAWKDAGNTVETP